MRRIPGALQGGTRKLEHYLDHLLRELELRSGLPCSKPAQVWLKVTERCNCRCRMCDIWKHNTSSQGELTTKEWKRVLQGLRDWLGKRHIWFTGGEPFLRPDFVELIRHASDSGFSTGVITNGILLNRESILEILDAGLSEFHVSIDSMDPEVHDDLRGLKGAFQKAMENTMLVKALSEENHSAIRIVLKMVIMGKNSETILPLVRWAKSHGLDEIKFQPLESNLEGKLDPHWFETSPLWPRGEEMGRTLEILDELIRVKLSGTPIHNTVQEFREMRNYFIDPVAYYERVKNHAIKRSEQQERCRSGVGQMEILSRGGLRFCLHMPPKGDVRSTAPSQLWRNRSDCWLKPWERCPRVQNEGGDSQSMASCGGIAKTSSGKEG